MKLRTLSLNLLVSLASILTLLLFMEIGLRTLHAIQRATQPDLPPLHIVVDSPILYDLNPAHPEINSQGVRGDEVPIPKPEGTFRILVLGDSIAYGKNVSKNEAFPHRLGELLREQLGAADVVNAGVSGYTAYNELQYYLTKGRKFQPDIVMVAFCMNDVVDPRLHWRGYTKRAIVAIPDEAIPNREYGLSYVLPALQKVEAEKAAYESWGEYSEVLGFLGTHLRKLFHHSAGSDTNARAGIPTYITAEEDLSIQVLLDDNSPEWRWLTSIYDQLNNAVRADHAKLAIVIFPLSYQLDKDYPFLPQDHLAEYCRKNSIFCIDLLPAFRRHAKDELFFPKDVWHPTAYGHDLSAQEIYRALSDAQLLRTPHERA
jgi:lysophospholipase L1-like esterase